MSGAKKRPMGSDISPGIYWLQFDNNCATIQMDDIGNTEPVYLLKDRTLPPPSSPTGAINLLTHHGLKNAYTKYCQKRVKETLSHYLPDLPGVANMTVDNDGLRFEI